MKVDVSIEFNLFDLMCSLVDATFDYHVLQEGQLMWLEMQIFIPKLWE